MKNHPGKKHAFVVDNLLRNMANIIMKDFPVLFKGELEIPFLACQLQRGMQEKKYQV